MSYPTCWYAYINGQVQGPFTPEQLAAMARSRDITAETPLCSDGATYVPAGQAMPQLFAPAFGPAAPPAPPPMAPPMGPQMAPSMAPPMGPSMPPPMGPPMMPFPAPRRGGKAALFVWLAVAAVAVGVALFFILSSGGGGGGALLSGLAAELPASERFEFKDLDAMESLGENVGRNMDDATGLPSSLNDDLEQVFPKGKRGSVAVARTGGDRVQVYCPRALDEAAFTKLLESSRFEKKSEGGVELWVRQGGGDDCVAMKKGRVYSGDEELVVAVVSGKLAGEKTLARAEGCRELLAQLSSSPASVEMRKESRSGSVGRDGVPEPSWYAQEMSVTSSRVRMRMLALFASAEDAEKADAKLKEERPKIEESMKRGRGLPVRDVEFESLDWSRSGTLLVMTGTFRRTGEGGSPPGK